MAIRRPACVLAMLLLLLAIGTLSVPPDGGRSGHSSSIDQEIPPDGIRIHSGDHQSAMLNERMADPLTVIVTENGTPLEGVNVRFEMASTVPGLLEGGGYTGTSVHVETSVDGTASASLSTGDQNGTILVNATWNGSTIVFTCHSVRVQARLEIHGDKETGVNILFDARGSTPGGGTNTTGFTFDFGDGSRSELQVAPTALHQYSSPGTYTVGLTVVHASGLNDTVRKQLTISEEEKATGLSPSIVWAFEVVAFVVLFASLYLFSRTLLKDAMARIRAPDTVPGEDKYDLAISLALSGEGKRALYYFNEVVREDPSNAKAHFYMGVVLMDRNRFKAARRAFERSLELDPDNEAARNSLNAVRALTAERPPMQ